MPTLRIESERLRGAWEPGPWESVLGLERSAGGVDEDSPEATLDELLDHEPGTVLRSVPGRTTFPWEGPQGSPTDGSGRARAIVKRTAADLPRDSWFERLRRSGPTRSPGEREFENLRGLARAGVPVPRALAWCRRAGEPTSLVVMERVPHTETLRERLARSPAAEVDRWADLLLSLVLRMHRAGWYHRDLYLQHFLVRGDELVLIDVGRARRQDRPRRRWFEKDLAALLHSTPPSVPLRSRLRFVTGWLRGMERPRGDRGRGERRRFLRGIVARQGRMAAHRPRHGEGDS